MEIQDILRKDISELSREDFASSWQVMHSTAKDSGGNIVGEAYGACYMPSVFASSSSSSQESQLRELMASPQYKRAQEAGWLELTAEEKSMKSRGLLEPIQGGSLLDINNELAKRGFKPFSPASVISQVISV